MFHDRREAGELLGRRLEHYEHLQDVVVLALPRGGVPVAYEVAKSLRAPLDVFVVRKLGVPWHRELAMGAIASGGVRVLNEDVIRQLNISSDAIEEVTEAEQRELVRRDAAFRDSRPRLGVAGKIVILVDDGLATGSTMRAAIRAVKMLRPARVVVAVPVGASETCYELAAEVDELICLDMPEPFFGVGGWYENFSQTTDEEVRDLLAHAAAAAAEPR